MADDKVKEAGTAEEFLGQREEKSVRMGVLEEGGVFLEIR